jgi:hypothetical protein
VLSEELVLYARYVEFCVTLWPSGYSVTYGMTVAVTFCTISEKGVAELGKARVVGSNLMVHGCPHSELLLLGPNSAALNVDEDDELDEVDELDGVDELDETDKVDDNDDVDKIDEVDVVDELE